MNRLEIVMLAASCLLGLPPTLPACTCSRLNLCQKAEKVPVIFVGEVVEDDLDLVENPWLARRAQLKAIETFRGLDEGQAEVELRLYRMGKGMCSPTFYQKGVSYLVYASRTADGKISDGPCSISMPLDQAADDLAYLREYFAGTTVTTIRGRIAQNEHESMFGFGPNAIPLPGVRVVARAGVAEKATVSDANGRFELVGVEPGLHQLHVSLSGFVSQNRSYAIDVKERGCAEIEIGMWTDASISGRVASAAGAPAAGIKVALLQPQRDGAYWPGRSVLTDASGRFVLDKVEPGTYRVGVNHNRMMAAQPYDARYFPAAQTVDDAVDVVIDGSGSVEAGVLQLGEPHATRTIRVSVEWPNEDPVNNATVNCESNSADRGSGQWEMVSAKTDDAGAASCLVLAEYPVLVRVGTLSWAYMFGPPRTHETTAPVEVLPGEFDVRVDLELNQEDDLRKELRAISNEESRRLQEAYEERRRKP